MSIPIGSLIANRYEVVKTLAGGMGLVYLCLDRAEDRPVALKTFQPQYLSNRAARDRFLREGTVWIELGRHPSIVRAYQVEYIGDGREVYLVLELVAGVEDKRDASLEAWLAPGKPLTVEQSLLFALHIARGMKYAATKVPGLVHRDLKPANVLVGRDGYARVTDFGLAGILTDSIERIPTREAGDELFTPRRLMTMAGGFVGTPEYASPEQFRGQALDERSDQYAFGCILYELLTGRAPFVLDCKTQTERLSKYKHSHQNDQSPQPRELVPALTAEIEAVVMRCLEKEPGARYGNWTKVEAAVAEAYRQALGKETPEEIVTEAETRAERIAAGWSYNAIGVSYRDIGKFDVAIGYFERVVKVGQTENELSLEAAGLDGLGVANRRIGKPLQAIEFLEQALKIAREIGDYLKEGSALGNLGNTYWTLGDSRRAITYHEQRLEIARKIGDRAGEARALGNLGAAYKELGDLPRAREFYEQDLKTAREIGHRRGEGVALGSLGTIYMDSGNVDRAMDFYKQALTIARETGDRQWEGQTLGYLGTAYAQLGDMRLAIEFLERALKIAREIGDLAEEGHTLIKLGMVHYRLGEAHQAIKFYEQGLGVARHIGNQREESEVLGELGNAYADLGDAPRAIGYHEQRLALSRKTGDRFGEGAALGNLGVISMDLLKDAGRAIEYHKQHLVIAPEIGDRAGEGRALGNLGLVYHSLGNIRQAIEYYERDLIITREIGDRMGESAVLGNLGAVHMDSLGDQSGAIQYYEQSLTIKREIGDIRGAANTSYNLALALFKQGRIPEARRHVEFAAQVFAKVGHVSLLERAKRLITRLRD